MGLASSLPIYKVTYDLLKLVTEEESHVTTIGLTPIYVDALIKHGWVMRGRHVPSCHLFTEGPLDALHAFAQGIGLKREWFQDKRIPHYDLTPINRARAIAAGAIEVDRRQAVEIWARIQHCGQGAKPAVVEAKGES